jgi:hypothetical protein
MVFASSYTNNPASMFGHTFLRVKACSERQFGTSTIAEVTQSILPPTPATEKGMLCTRSKAYLAHILEQFSTFPYYQKIHAVQ